MKIKVLTTVVMAVFLLTTITTAQAVAITSPSVPEFSVKYVDHSYTIPTTCTYDIDPYTGENITILHYGEHISNRTFEVIIKNEPFTPLKDEDNNSINYFYDVRYKGAFADEGWFHVYGYSSTYQGVDTLPISSSVYGYPIQNYSNSNTIIIIELDDDLPSWGQMDIQVKAMKGYTNKIAADIPLQKFGVLSYKYELMGEQSNWSATQTVQFGNSPTPTPKPISQATDNTTIQPTVTIKPSSFSTIPELVFVALMLTIGLVMVSAVILISVIKRGHKV